MFATLFPKASRVSGNVRRSSRLEVESLEGRALPSALGASVLPVAVSAVAPTEPVPASALSLGGSRDTGAANGISRSAGIDGEVAAALFARGDMQSHDFSTNRKGEEIPTKSGYRKGEEIPTKLMSIDYSVAGGAAGGVVGSRNDGLGETPDFSTNRKGEEIPTKSGHVSVAGGAAGGIVGSRSDALGFSTNRSTGEEIPSKSGYRTSGELGNAVELSANRSIGEEIPSRM